MLWANLHIAFHIATFHISLLSPHTWFQIRILYLLIYALWNINQPSARAGILSKEGVKCEGMGLIVTWLLLGPQLCQLLAGWSWVRFSTLLRRSFFICKNENSESHFCVALLWEWMNEWMNECVSTRKLGCEILLTYWQEVPEAHVHGLALGELTSILCSSRGVKCCSEDHYVGSFLCFCFQQWLLETEKQA